MAERYTPGELRRMSEADLAVSEHDPDVRGWTAISSEGSELGDVDDLIVDTAAMKVRYLQVDPDAGVTDSDEPIYIPIEKADVDRDRRRVVVRGPIASIRSLVPPEFGRQFGSTETARTERGGGARNDRDVQRMTRAEEEVQVSKRPVEAGEVRVGKHVETEHRRENVSVAREDVRVERRPVTDRNAPAEIRASEHEIRVPVKEEEVVVEKRPVVKEEIVISKERVEDTRPIDVDVRKEEFDIHDDRKDRNRDVAGRGTTRGGGR